MIPDTFSIQIPRTVIGLGAIKNIGDIVNSFAPTNILIVCGPTVAKTGILDPIKAALEKGGYKYDVFSGCRAEGPISIGEELGQKVKDRKYDLLIGVGGGSSMDTTKVASIIAANDGISVRDLLGGKVAQKVVPKILIPTTAGTGSEWGIAAVLSDDRAGGKTGVVITTQNYPDAVIIDSELTLSIPQRTTADTGIDALTCSIEAYISPKANIISDMAASTAIKLIAENLRLAYAKGRQNIEARYSMSIAASLAIFAAMAASIGLVHYMNEPLGRKAHCSHGTALVVLLPTVMEYNLMASPAKFASIAELMGENIGGLSISDAAAKSVEAVIRLIRDLNLPQRMGDVGITEADIPEMVEEVHTSYSSLMINETNPRNLSREDTKRLYTLALGGHGQFVSGG